MATTRENAQHWELNSGAASEGRGEVNLGTAWEEVPVEHLGGEEAAYLRLTPCQVPFFQTPDTASDSARGQLFHTCLDTLDVTRFPLSHWSIIPLARAWEEGRALVPWDLEGCFPGDCKLAAHQAPTWPPLAGSRRWDLLGHRLLHLSCLKTGNRIHPAP